MIYYAGFRLPKKSKVSRVFEHAHLFKVTAPTPTNVLNRIRIKGGGKREQRMGGFTIAPAEAPVLV